MPVKFSIRFSKVALIIPDCATRQILERSLLTEQSGVGQVMGLAALLESLGVCFPHSFVLDGSTRSCKTLARPPGPAGLENIIFDAHMRRSLYPPLLPAFMYLEHFRS